MVVVTAGDGPGGHGQILQRPHHRARHQSRHEHRQQKGQCPGEEQWPQEVGAEKLARRWLRLGIENERPAQSGVRLAEDQPARAVAVDERAEDAAAPGVGHDQAGRPFDLRQRIAHPVIGHDRVEDDGLGLGVDDEDAHVGLLGGVEQQCL